MLSPGPVVLQIHAIHESDVRGVAYQSHFDDLATLLVPEVVLNELHTKPSISVSNHADSPISA